MDIGSLGPKLCLHHMCVSRNPLFFAMFSSVLVALLLTASAQAERNVTIDDMDPRVVYQPPVEWSSQGNVRPLQFSKTVDPHFDCRRPPRRIE